MIAVSDTSPLNYLVLIDAIDVLAARYERVLIPPAIASELSHTSAPTKVREWLAQCPEWIEIRTLQNPSISAPLGSGEREAISLAIETTADELLIDDRRARAIARSLSLPIVGTLALLFSAEQAARLNLTDALARLAATSFRIDPKILAEMKNTNDLTPHA